MRRAAEALQRHQVRTRLFAGGRWIRTIGTAYETTLLATAFGPAIRLPRQKPALSCQGPMIRIHFPPASSQLRTREGMDRTPQGCEVAYFEPRVAELGQYPAWAKIDMSGAKFYLELRHHGLYIRRLNHWGDRYVSNFCARFGRRPGDGAGRPVFRRWREALGRDRDLLRLYRAGGASLSAGRSHRLRSGHHPA